MIIRPYNKNDKQLCIDVFVSNLPKYFANEELPPFINWLDVQGNGSGPAYGNSEKDEYYVVVDNGTIVGCGGFYIVRGLNKANLAWGMIHNAYHKKGFGTALYEYRKNEIRKNYPDHIITLGTSQHTFPFYEHMGMKVVADLKDGYGVGIDRYDMEER